jgi:hypothetical protein
MLVSQEWIRFVPDVAIIAIGGLGSPAYIFLSLVHRQESPIHRSNGFWIIETLTDEEDCF